ncbi:hypothetical protein NN561_015597 [Cricetulus griseus]
MQHPLLLARAPRSRASAPHLGRSLRTGPRPASGPGRTVPGAGHSPGTDTVLGCGGCFPDCSGGAGLRAPPRSLAPVQQAVASGERSTELLREPESHLLAAGEEDWSCKEAGPQIPAGQRTLRPRSCGTQRVLQSPLAEAAVFWDPFVHFWISGPSELRALVPALLISHLWLLRATRNL